MKHLLIKLALGLYDQDITQEYLPIIQKLFQNGYIKKEGQKYKINSKYRFGSISLHSKNGAYLHVIGENLKDIYISDENLNNASEGDLVVVQRFLTKKGPPSGKVVEILGKLESYSVGIILEKNDKKSLLNLKTMHLAGVELTQEEIDKYEVGTLFKINNQTSSIMQELGNIKNPLVDERIVLAQFNKHEEFEEDVINQAKSFKEVDISLHKDRKDLRDLPFCTIDPVTAKDFDDAIYWDDKISTLYVAIADVSYYVKPFGAIDAEAIYRSFSIYFPHKSIPMLPRVLSETLCSLQPNKNRLAYVFEIKLDLKNLEVKNSKVYEAIIHSRRRFNYDEVDNLLENNLKPQNEIEAEIFIYLKKLKKITDKLREKRLQKGFDFRSDEIEIKLDKDTNIISTYIEKETPSHSLIEDCMLLANKEAAKMYEKGIFRIHEEPSQAKLQNLYQELAGIGLNVEIKDTIKETIEQIQKNAKEMNLENEVDTLIIKAQMQARYSPINLGHFGLGFDRYTHFTSPIRRYSDLVVHRLLKAIQQNKKEEESYLLRNIEALCISISQKEREADMVENEYKQRKFARWALENTSKNFNAKIISTIPEYKAELDDEIKGAILYINNHTDAKLFQKVKIQIDQADIYSGKIYAKVIKS